MSIIDRALSLCIQHDTARKYSEEISRTSELARFTECLPSYLPLEQDEIAATRIWFDTNDGTPYALAERLLVWMGEEGEFFAKVICPAGHHPIGKLELPYRQQQENLLKIGRIAQESCRTCRLLTKEVA